MSSGTVNAQTRHRKIGNLIAAVRQARGYTQGECAAAAGIGTTTLERVEYGNGRVRRRTLERVGTVLAIPDSVLDVVLVAHGYLPTEATWQRLLAADRQVNGGGP